MLWLSGSWVEPGGVDWRTGLRLQGKGSFSGETQIPFGNDNHKGKRNSNCRSPYYTGGEAIRCHLNGQKLPFVTRLSGRDDRFWAGKKADPFASLRDDKQKSEKSRAKQKSKARARGKSKK